MFLGKYFCGLDKEYRFEIPEGFSKHLTDEIYITQGFDHNLWVLSKSAFQEIYKKISELKGEFFKEVQLSLFRYLS